MSIMSKTDLILRYMPIYINVPKTDWYGCFELLIELFVFLFVNTVEHVQFVPLHLPALSDNPWRGFHWREVHLCRPRCQQNRGA